MSSLQSSVLVIGGGVAGIQVSLDLTELGFKVYLVEKKPTIGGTMAQLDKTFPTLDCSLCILAPKMVEVFRNPNIELLTYSHVNSIEGYAGNYTIKVIRQPRYIKEDICTGCSDCAAVCPVRDIPSDFDVGLKTHAAAFIPFPSSVPPIYVIDDKKCLQLNYGICGLCAKVCNASAIDFSQKSKEIEIKVGAIVIATGYEQKLPGAYSELGGGSFNVLSSMQFERLMCASGPTGGQIVRLKDKDHPHSIAFLQCVGSRDFHHLECKKYCSSICCMAAAKQAIIAKEHAPDTDCYIFNTEIRAKGKGFYEFIVKSQEEYGVKYINGKVSFVEEDSKTGKLRLYYEDLDEGTVKNMDVDLAVLASALYPNASYYKFLKCLKIEPDDLGYIKDEDMIRCEEECIYFTGFAKRPKDIPTSVAESSACAGKISERLSAVRFQKIEEIKYPPEIPVKPGDEPRVGILVCRCGINIGGIVDVKKVVEYVSKLPYVVHAQENMYSCSSDSQEQIKNMIKKYNLNRFIVASCTPRTHEVLFRNTLREVGLNPFLFELVNIRDQDSWVHQKEPEKATKKACDLIRMYLAKVVNLKPLQKMKVKVVKASLIIGGGIAGLVAAHNLVKQGFDIYLVNKKPYLGGKSIVFTDIYDMTIHKNEIINKINELTTSPNAHIILNSKIVDIKGYVGNYDVKVEDVQDNSKIQEFKVGTIIVSTGTYQTKTERWQDLSEKFHDRIITQQEFGLKKDMKIPKVNDATMILCVDQRKNKFNNGDMSKTYCSNICCLIGLKNIEKLLHLNPDAHVHVLYRELQLSELTGESEWRDLRKQVLFERYRSIDDVHVTENNGNLHLKYKNVGAETEIEYDTDLVILATPVIPADDTKDIAKLLKVPTTKDGFFLEAHVKLRPVDFATDGIFLCGGAHWPKWIDESITQAYAAAGRAAMLMVKGEIETEGITSHVNPEKCIGCGKCVDVCPYKAIEVIESTKQMGLFTITQKKTSIIDAVCKGCGACIAECPLGAIDQKQFSKFQIQKQIDLLTGIDQNIC